MKAPEPFSSVQSTNTRSGGLRIALGITINRKRGERDEGVKAHLDRRWGLELADSRGGRDRGGWRKFQDHE